MHGQEEGDACEVGEYTADKRDALRQRERWMAGGQKTGAVRRMLCHVMWVNLKLEIVSFPDQVFMGHSALQNNRIWIRKLEPC